MNARRRRFQRIWRGALGLAGIATAWQCLAVAHVFSPALTPPLGMIWRSMGTLVADGSIFIHIAATFARVLAGMAIGCVVGTTAGILIGRSRRAERISSPLLSVLMPIPSLAWVPLLVLWFGLGMRVSIIVVAYATVFPMIYSSWTGVRSINPLWIKSASAMGASRQFMFRHVILPGALPHIIGGLRLAFGRGWIAVIGAELLSATDWGLGRLIFEAKEWLSTDIVLGTLLIIGLFGLITESAVFQVIERVTIQRWGMTGRR
jgi:NitT/TauT family transport system permease protein